MDVTDKIRQFINDSIDSHFDKQTEVLRLIIHKESVSAIADLKTFIGELFQANERDMANMLQTVFSLLKRFQEMSDKLDAIQESINKLNEKQEINIPTPPIVIETPPKPTITIQYAKMVDSAEPPGFKIANLKDFEEGCAFKITLTDGKEGTFAFLDDEEIQQELLAAFHPLISDSSTYEFISGNAEKINVLQDGTVLKEGEVLRITNKQKIEIVRNEKINS